ncbi:MAG: right-handed parallel beta-helix repeat-containing protein [Acidobacteriota bacterium]
MLPATQTIDTPLPKTWSLAFVNLRKLLLLFWAFIAFFFYLSASAQAKTIYVASNGKDSNSGTLQRPVASPAQALAMSEAGDTIYLRAGRYSINHFLWVDKPGITIASYPKERATLTSGTEETDSNANNILILVADNISILDIDIEGGSYYGIKIDIDRAQTTKGVTLRGCRIRNTGRDCIKSFRADKLLIENCEIGPSGIRDASNAEGIDAIASVGITIRGCYIHDTATNGLYLKGGTREGLVERNRLERAGHAGILLGQDTDEAAMRDGAKYEALNCVARNNIISDTRGAGIGSYSGSQIRFENNTLYDVAKQMQAGFYVVTNSRAVMAEKISFKNNIVVVLSERPLVLIKNLGDPLLCDTNIWFSPRQANNFHREVELAGKFDKWSFADWQRQLRIDAHSFFADPLLDPASLFKPRAGSPAFDSGEQLPEIKTDYRGNPRPQGAAFDIGAYEVGGNHESATTALPERNPDVPDTNAEIEEKDETFVSRKKQILVIVFSVLSGILIVLCIYWFRAKNRAPKNIRI